MKPSNLPHWHRTTLVLSTALGVISVLTGCSVFRASSGPKPPLVINNHTLQYNYHNPQATNYFRSLYNQADNQKLVRNQIIDELIGQVNQNYHQYEVALRDGRNVLDLSATLAAMGTSAAATVAGGEGAKTILSAITTGILGADAAVNKTLYKELATEAILSEMRHLRADRELVLTVGKTNTVEDYTLNQGINDIVEYYNAGFVTSAMVSIASNSAQAAETARTNAVAVRLSLGK